MISLTILHILYDRIIFYAVVLFLMPHVVLIVWYHCSMFLFAGLGVLLVVVVAVGWKCTPRGHEPLHALFHLGNFRQRGQRSRRRRGHQRGEERWYGGQ